MKLSERALIHADNMQSEGWYTTANVLAACADAIDDKPAAAATKAFVASIRSSIGQIKKAQEKPTANSWLKIEIACDKLMDAAASFERAALSRS
jgi:hypothetical protein